MDIKFKIKLRLKVKPIINMTNVSLVLISCLTDNVTVRCYGTKKISNLFKLYRIRIQVQICAIVFKLFKCSQLSYELHTQSTSSIFYSWLQCFYYLFNIDMIDWFLIFKQLTDFSFHFSSYLHDFRISRFDKINFMNYY